MALYNNGFPATYQPLYPSYTPVPVQQQNTQAQQSGLNWIQGEQAAKSYLVAPNSSVVLFDSEAQVIYIKSADASGMPSMKILDYNIRQTGVNAPNSLSGTQDNNSINYATKAEIEGVEKEIAQLKSKLDKLMKRKVDDEDE